MRRLAALCGLIVGMVGCTDLLPPPGVDPYEYRTFVPVNGEMVGLAFHWPRGALPITVYVDKDSPLRPSVRRAMDAWQDTFVYGEVRFALTDDPAAADIVVRNEVATKPAPTTLHLAGRIDGCLGQTDFDANPEAGTLTPPFQIRVWSLTTPTNPGLAECFDATVLHELGHALGIFAHSPSADDVMNVSPTRTDLSPRDRATIEAVYHLPANLRPET